MYFSHIFIIVAVVAVSITVWGFFSMFRETELRKRKLRNALAGLLRISDCHCDGEGTCAFCHASSVLAKEYSEKWQPESPDSPLEP